jgi:hypothetical protein
LRAAEGQPVGASEALDRPQAKRKADRYTIWAIVRRLVLPVSWSDRRSLAMTLTIFDPITGKHVTIARPDKPRA